MAPNTQFLSASLQATVGIPNNPEVTSSTHDSQLFKTLSARPAGLYAIRACFQTDVAKLVLTTHKSVAHDNTAAYLVEGNTAYWAGL